MIQAIIFDFDGTILETELPDYLSWQETYQEHQCELPIALWLDAVGGSVTDFDPYAYLEQQAGRALDRPQIREKRRARMNELIAQQSIRPGVIGVIAAAQQLGLRLGVASSSGRDWVEGYLERFDLRHHFEVIFTREDVVRVKPDPALYSLAVNALGVLPQAAVAIEVVPNDVTQQLHFPEADLQMASLADRPLEEWLQELYIPSQG
jgi:HAD superfamily hydrolase (TIGR01509 family)